MNAAFALQGISPTDTLVLVALANFANDEWSCFPSRGTLVIMTKLSPRAITLSMRRLEDAGYLASEARLRANGSQTTNRYILHLGAGGEFAAPLNAPPPRQQVGGVGQRSAPPEPPLNPKKELGVLDVREPFDLFWVRYPLKKAKDAARVAFSKAMRRVEGLDPLAVILAGVDRYVEEIARTDILIKHPATWLNGGCWTDEPSPHGSQTDGQPARRPGGIDHGADRARARLQAMDEGSRIASATGRRRWSLG